MIVISQLQKILATLCMGLSLFFAGAIFAGNPSLSELESQLALAREQGDTVLESEILDKALQELVPALDEKKERVGRALELEPLQISPNESLDNRDDEKMLLRCKLNVVFENLINSSCLGQDSLVLLETVKTLFFHELEHAFSVATEKKVLLFVQAAKIIKSFLQIFTLRPGFAVQCFDSAKILRIDEYRLNDLFVQMLDEMYRRLVKQAEVAAALAVDVFFTVLNKEGIIDVVPVGYLGCLWRKKNSDVVSFENSSHPLYKIIRIFPFDEDFIDLIQEFFDLENEVLMLRNLPVPAKEEDVLRFNEKSDALLERFYRNQGVSGKDCVKGVQAWTRIFVAKVLLLKRDFRMRMHVSAHKNAEMQDIYFKHMVVIRDQAFEDLSLYSELRSFVSRYESVVIRFLSGKQEAKLDFCCELFALISHFNSIVNIAEPTGVFLWLKEKMGITCKRVGVERYFGILKQMAAVLECINRILKPDEGFLQVTQNLFAQLTSKTGNSMNSRDVALSSLGITGDQLSKFLLSGSQDSKLTVMKLLSYLSPVLVASLVRYVQGNGRDAKVSSEALTHGFDAKVVAAQISPDLIKKLEEKAPGLMDVLVKYAQQQCA